MPLFMIERNFAESLNQSQVGSMPRVRGDLYSRPRQREAICE